MAYEFTKLADVPALEAVPEGANAFIEVEGEIKRVPGDGLGGGGGGIPTAIIRLNTDTGDGASIAALADLTGGAATVSAADGSRAEDTPIYTGVCDNMTFAEAKAALLDGGALDARVVFALDAIGEGAVIIECVPAFDLGYFTANGCEFVGVTFTATLTNHTGTTLCWLPDGTITSDQSALNPK